MTAHARPPKSSSRTVPLTIAAYRLGRSYNATLRLLLTGTIKGERQGKRWMVDESSLRAFAANQGIPQ